MTTPSGNILCAGCLAPCLVVTPGRAVPLSGVVDPVVELHGLLAGDEAVAQAGPLLFPGHAALDHCAVVVLPGGGGGVGRRRGLLRL